MRRLLLLLLTVWGTAALARVFRDSSHYKSHNFASSYSSRRILRSPGSFARSRVFRNVVINANDSSSVLDEPRSRAQGRFYKRAQAVPIHDPTRQPSKDAVHVTAYSYDEEKHHEKKLVEDTMTMVEANEFARGLERTTVSVKNEETTTTPIPTTSAFSLTTKASTKPEFQQPPAAFAQLFQPPQPAPVFKQSSGSKTFAQTLQAEGPLSGMISRPTMGFTGFPVPGQPQPFVGFIPPVPAIPARIGLPSDPLVPPLGIPPQPPIIPPNGPAGVSPNFTPPTIPPNQLPHVPGASGGGHHPPNGSPRADGRFEVINQQSANSSLEQLGCGFDWLTNTCKDYFNIGWCGRCHDFGNIFLHDCKCIQPLVPLPPRPTAPTQPPHPPPRTPAFLRYIF